MDKDTPSRIIRLEERLRGIEEDLHNRIRAAEKRLDVIEREGDRLLDRVDALELRSHRNH